MRLPETAKRSSRPPSSLLFSFSPFLLSFLSPFPLFSFSPFLPSPFLCLPFLHLSPLLRVHNLGTEVFLVPISFVSPSRTSVRNSHLVPFLHLHSQGQSTVTHRYIWLWASPVDLHILAPLNDVPLSSSSSRRILGKCHRASKCGGISANVRSTSTRWHHHRWSNSWGRLRIELRTFGSTRSYELVPSTVEAFWLRNFAPWCFKVGKQFFCAGLFFKIMSKNTQSWRFHIAMENSQAKFDLPTVKGIKNILVSKTLFRTMCIIGKWAILLKKGQKWTENKPNDLIRRLKPFRFCEPDRTRTKTITRCVCALVSRVKQETSSYDNQIVYPDLRLKSRISCISPRPAWSNNLLL